MRSQRARSSEEHLFERAKAIYAALRRGGTHPVMTSTFKLDDLPGGAQAEAIHGSVKAGCEAWLTNVRAAYVVSGVIAAVAGGVGALTAVVALIVGDATKLAYTMIAVGACLLVGVGALLVARQASRSSKQTL